MSGSKTEGSIVLCSPGTEGNVLQLPVVTLFLGGIGQWFCLFVFLPGLLFIWEWVLKQLVVIMVCLHVLLPFCCEAFAGLWFFSTHTLNHSLVGGSFFRLWLPSLALIYSLVSIGPLIRKEFLRLPWSWTGPSGRCVSETCTPWDSCVISDLEAHSGGEQQRLMSVLKGQYQMALFWVVVGDRAFPVDPRTHPTNKCDGSEERLL